MASYYEGHPLNPQRDNRYGETPYNTGARGPPPAGGRHGDPMSLVPGHDSAEGSYIEEIRRDFPPGSYGDPYSDYRSTYDDRRSFADRGGRRSRSLGGRDRYGSDYPPSGRHEYRSK
jgi:hypothetical protein